MSQVLKKRELFEKLLEKEGLSKSSRKKIDRRQRANICLPSFSQQRLWFLDQFEPGNPAYNMPAAFRLEGNLNVTALEQSLNEICQRHEVLRSSFTAKDGMPMVHIAPALHLELWVDDLSHLSGEEQEREVHRLTNEEAQEPFDLSQAPLLRTRLLRLDEQAHILLVTIHHILFDGWSLGILVREMAWLYKARCAGSASSLPELAAQYADYALWQREELKDEVLETQLSYWKEKLAGAPPLIEMLADRPRSVTQTFCGARRDLELSPGLTTELDALSRREGVTLFMTLLASFQLLLHRHTFQDDIVLGSPIAGRSHHEVEDLMGFFVNTLVLRTDLSGEPSFQQLLGRVREVALGAYAHQDLPFELLVEKLQPERGSSHTPLFQVFFNMLNLPEAQDAIWMDGIRVEAIPPSEIHAKFDLTLYAQEREGRIRLVLVYNTDLFESARAAHLLDQFEHLLSQIVHDPAQRISNYSLRSPASEALVPNPAQTLSCDWEGTVHSRFSAHARRGQDRLAVVDPQESWTYEELDARSNQLANYLLVNGIQPADVVAVYGHRSASLVWALLGTLKAGAAFVILDPSFPAARLIGCVSMVKPKAWLQIAMAGDPPDALWQFVQGLSCRATLRLPRRSVAEATGLLEDYSSDAPEAAVGPDDLAYVAFTSGSMGAPKGILGGHRPLSHFLQWHTRNHDLNEADRFSMLSGLSHDPLLRDIFTPLWVGATLCIPDPQHIAAPGWLAKWIKQMGISVAHLTPAMVGLLDTSGPPNDQDGSAYLSHAPLRYAFFGGDVLTQSDVARTRKLMPSAVCVNFYGATETPQAMASFTAIGHEAPPGAEGIGNRVERVPIGRGIEGAQLLILNKGQGLAGIGEIGEINIRTPYLAKGYLNDPVLSSERIIRNPFSEFGGDLIYKSGDLGRYLSDGNVEFLGRRDRQVKIRGYRIELGDIESALGRHPHVREAVAVATEDAAGHERLVAYVTARDQGVSTGDLQQFLKDELPDFMRPSPLVLLDEIPLTSNGKVDYRALPPPDFAGLGMNGSAEAPSTPGEELLAGIWARVLNVDSVGVNQSFFELGGHSLLATHLIALVQKQFQVELSLQSFFKSPTVSAMAETITNIKAERGEQPSQPLPTLKPAPERRHLPFPLTDIQQAYLVGRSGAIEEGNVASQRYLELEGIGIDVERFNRVWLLLIERHDMLRAVLVPAGQQTILESVPEYRIETLDLRAQSVQRVESELADIRQRMTGRNTPTDCWPLFEIRASLLDNQRTRLHLRFDYLIADASSFLILMQELLELYHNPDGSLAPLELSFRDYVLAEVAIKDTKLYRRSKDYWWSRLPTLPPAPELPLAQSWGSLARPQFVRRSARLEPHSWQRLKQRAAVAGLTPSGVLLAAFCELLAAWNKTPRFTIVLTLFKRLPLHEEVNRIVGDFTSTTLLAVENSTGAFEQKAQRLQEQLWLDLDHMYISGVEVLREMSRIQRGISKALMPVVFTSTLNLRASGHGITNSKEFFDVVYSISQTPQVLFDHQVYEQGDALCFNWDVVEALFQKDVLDDMFGAYVRLLQGLADEEQRWHTPVQELVPAYQLKLREEINSTEAPISGEMLHTLFAAQVAGRGQHPAVISSTHTLSYAELGRRSNQLGRCLLDQGARPNKLVAIVMEKGWEQVVAALGILQSGAAYLPIEANLPKDRVWYLLENSQIELALTQSWLDQALQWPPSVQRICIDTDKLDDFDDRALHPAQKLDDLAYVIYTSGSTGLPKGVMIDHRGAVNTILDINSRFGIQPDDRVMAISSLSFDLSVYDVFGMLAAGGTIVIPDARASKEPQHWAELIKRHRVTVWNSVPALMEMLVQYAADRADECLNSLRLVMLSGDWIPLTLPGQIKDSIKGIPVVSLGGATEASIWSILYPIERIDPEWKSIPYGRPMLNQSFHVLNAALEPCPVWVVGQLYIGGIGLAKGYWQDDEKTSASFITHPRTCQRLYRTGDLGRYLPDGNIEFLGREDYQVKVQGFRIELGEIEAALAEHPGVRLGVVRAIGERQGNKHLVAYIVPESERKPTVTDFQTFLMNKLPDYMVPSSFVMLDSLPLTSNGKVDRGALPALTGIELCADEEFAEPSNAIEEMLVQMYKQALAIERVGINDNFFSLGGNSLCGMQLVSKIREVFKVDLPLRLVFEMPTVAAISRSILLSQSENLGNEDLAEILVELDQISQGEPNKTASNGSQT